MTRNCLPTFEILPIETFVIALVRCGADTTGTPWLGVGGLIDVPIGVSVVGAVGVTG